jgi:signal transduction histidine kinase
VLPKIFVPFFTTKAVGSGTGLGLSVSSKTLEEMGGTIGVDSRPGRTVFTVTIPGVVVGREAEVSEDAKKA